MISSDGESNRTMLKMKNRTNFFLQNMIIFFQREMGTCIYKYNKKKGYYYT